ncbi:OLC1v1000685C1 [Oldenlandia corymbosa var. corymbosa]|uniref:OLC1v1000685C1 n=1 Tax=Oldenlandia corymbosa var. corymbosa TaxID=529605 RepID=A0AAV1D5Q8_OLDCO|nr:OLC1v1000685C1 [Oldenlandia corymbosa var. corymbosa]
MSTKMLIRFLLFQLFLYFSCFIIHPSISQTFPDSASNVGVRGQWHLLQESIGISAMHMQLLHNNKVVIFDRTDFGKSNLSLPGGRCRNDKNEVVLKVDCTAHSVLYDIETNQFRPLMVQTDTWCSSGAVIPDGALIQTGGFNDGDHIVRRFVPCDDNRCDWEEFPGTLVNRRWYASNQILPDGRIIIVGGRGQFNYEFYNPRGNSAFQLDFLRETSDESENNLYPFLHLLPDGNLFIFANTRSIVFDYKQNRLVREFPSMPGDVSRNYPSSGSSVLLPIDENVHTEVEILICGGSSPDAFNSARRGNFPRASSTCGRLRIYDDNPAWKMETMPVPRVMGDMLILPNGQVIIVNGAMLGCAGWENARSPVTRPLIYNPNGSENNRFAVMETASRPRLYHSTAILMTDGRVLVGGSNPHIFYQFSSEEFPTDLSLEAFSPPYFAPTYDSVRPRIVGFNPAIRYRRSFSVTFRVSDFLGSENLSVRIVAPSFTTHSFSMNQRMIILKGVNVTRVAASTYNVVSIGPSRVEVAPQGFYMLFVVHGETPSTGQWVNLS